MKQRPIPLRARVYTVTRAGAGRGSRVHGVYVDFTYQDLFNHNNIKPLAKSLSLGQSETFKRGAKAALRAAGIQIEGEDK